MPRQTFTAGQVLTAAQMTELQTLIGCDQITASTAFTTAGTVNVNNVFTTAYRHIQVDIHISAASTTLQVLLRMRAAGSDNSASQYFMGMNSPNYAADTVLFGPRSNAATSFGITPNNAGNNRVIQLDFVQAANALTTIVSGYSAQPGNAEVFYIAGAHAVATAFDGFSLITSTGTITGTYSVLGFR